MDKPCDDCGQTHTRCAGHKKRVVPKQPCMAQPRAGATVCENHGGGAPQVKAKAKARVQEAAVVAAALRFAVPIEVSPSEGLIQEVHRTAGVIAWAEQQVIRICGDTPDNLIRGTRSVKRTVGQSVEGPVDVTATEVGPLLNFWVDLWQKERRHFVDVCKTTLAAGVEERRIQLAEQEGERQGRWLQACLAPLNLSDSQMRAVMSSASSHLHLLQGTG
jgi:hypothetical protein